jgi:hypothetical protein
MTSCKILQLDTRKRRAASDLAAAELPAYSAMTADGVMTLPTERRQAEIVDGEELRERRRLREAGRR